MGMLNVEIKAKPGNHSKIRELINSRNVISKAVGHQIDTYFNVTQGCLKLREGNIENNLIYCIKENKESPKQSKIRILKANPESTLKEILTVVDKAR